MLEVVRLIGTDTYYNQKSYIKEGLTGRERGEGREGGGEGATVKKEDHSRGNSW